MLKRDVAAAVVAIVLVALLAACGGKPMPFPTPASELGDRPGLVTGESGSWTVFQR
jgi:hypothetical protein